MRKIIYLNYFHINLTTIKNRFIQDLIAKNIEFEYWDLSNIFGISTNVTEVEEYTQYVKYYDDYKTLETALQEHADNSIFVCLITYEYNAIRLYKLLKQYKTYTCFIVSTMTPYGFLLPMWKRILNRLNRSLDVSFYIKKTRDYIAVLYKKFDIVKKHDCVFLVNEEHFVCVGRGAKYDKQKAELTFINAYEYDVSKSITVKDSKNNIPSTQKKAVFIDSYLPYHPDNKILNFNINAELYFDELNYFFDYIEKKYNYEIEISLHPKAEYINTPYKHRKAFKLQTLEMIRNTDLVISHASIANSFSVIFNKPIVLLVSDLFRNHIAFETTYNYADYFDCQTINLSREKEYKLQLDIKQNAYASFLHTHLTNKYSKDKLSQEIFIEKMKSIE